MRLLEFQAKRLLAEQGIPVPESKLVQSLADLPGIPLPAVLKAQVPIGGRGKAGGIRMAAGQNEALDIFNDLIGSKIRGYPVQAILAEAQTSIEREIYLAVLLDKRANQPMVMASAAGGIDIEQVAEQAPEQIAIRHIDPFIGLPTYTKRYLAQALALDDIAAFGTLLDRLYALFRSHDATLVEINPLAVTGTGLVALDAKVILDDKAAFRHADLFASLSAEQEQIAAAEGAASPGGAEQLAAERGITYVSLDGDIAMIADGAGTGMLTVDLIQDAGGRAANFCELGGHSNAEVMCQGIEVVLANPRAKALLISLIGGMTRMDEMADGVVQYMEHNELHLPVVVRMYGTQAEVGRATLRDVGIDAFEDLPEAVDRVVALAGEQ
jgi:succinyl-CoA synthetase beta subunit